LLPRPLIPVKRLCRHTFVGALSWAPNPNVPHQERINNVVQEPPMRETFQWNPHGVIHVAEVWR